jgi:YHS domain-containing protein
MGRAAELVRDYLGAYSTGNVEGALSLVAEDYSLNTPALQATGGQARAELAAMVGHLGPFARGYKMLRQWEDGPQVCSIYELCLEPPTGPVCLTISQWDTVRKDRLVSSVLLFDTTVLSAGGSGAKTVDPVCHMLVDPLSAPARGRHGSEDYFFCSQACAERFESHPDLYLASAH